MIISQQKPLVEVLKSIENCHKIFLIGCGECATTCKTGGQAELEIIKQELEKAGKTVLGYCIPEAPCVAAKIKNEIAKNIKLLKESDAVLVYACGLGAQSVKDNDRFGLLILPGNDTLCAGVMDAWGNFFEKCSLCGECILDKTFGICPVTLCPKGILNGPCGGMDKGKCEVDKEKDCAWVLIYKESSKKNKIEDFKKILGAKDFKKMLKPRKVMMSSNKVA